MNKTKIIVVLLLILVALAFVGGIFTHRAFIRSQDPPEPIIIERTEYIPQPVPVMVEPAPDSIPSVTIRKEDILPAEDTATVRVRPQVSTFTDTLSSGVSYNIKTSGIGTRVEGIAISWPEREIVKPTPYKGWSVDLVGHGILTDFNKEGVSGFAGIELGYTCDRFSFGIGPGAMWSRPPGASSHQASLAVMASVRVQLFRF